MLKTTVQEVLNFVEKPSRYLGNEINSIVKDKSTVKINFALAFPDLYDIGTSHFGIQILYHILNKIDYIHAERVFSPAQDLENILKIRNEKLFSLETKTPLDKFDIIGFSLLYELNYTGILSILNSSGIPFLASERDNNHPLIIGGGPCTCNPEPVAEIFDAIVIGDGEDIIIEISSTYLKWKESGNSEKTTLLKELSKLKGIYIPSFFKAESDENGLQILKPVYEDYKTINKSICMDLNSEKFPDKPVIPYGKPIHDRLRLEISRGCSRGCRFCQAGLIYRPVRERQISDLVDIAKKTILNSGYEDISLLSLSTGDYSDLIGLMNSLTCSDFKNNFSNIKPSLSLPSIRAGKLTPEIIDLLKSIKKTGFTIAPEAGTQKLRDIINKGLTEEEILNTSKNVFEAGWKTLKLYFMIGLPGEEFSDIEGIVDIVKKIKQFSKSRKNSINVSVSVFIPKPHTPFQWHSQISHEKSKEYLYYIKSNLRIPGISVKYGSEDISFLEGVWSRGDRKLTKLLINAFNKGCRFDGWNEYLEIDKWKQALTEENIDPLFYCSRKRDFDEILPWDHINTGIDKTFLTDEYTKAMKQEITKDCKYNECYSCGVCDFDEIKHIINKDIIDLNDENYNCQNDENYNYKKISVLYSKTGISRFFGHLELVNIFIKAIKRSNINLKYTNGFNKKPKIVFKDTLPLGIESHNEEFVIEIPLSYQSEDLLSILNKNLPEGLKITNIIPYNKNNIKTEERYTISSNNYIFDLNMLNIYDNSNEFFIEKTTKKGLIKQINCFYKNIN